MGLLSSLFGGGKTAHDIPAEPKRKNAKTRTKSNKPNKLSKPRTNTSANNLLDVPGVGISRQSSLASVNARRKRSISVPVRSDADLAFTDDAGEDAGLGRGRQQERDKRSSRLSSLFRSKSSTPGSVVLQDRPDDKWILDDNGGVEALDNSDPLRRYSQMGLAGYAQDLPIDSQFSVTDSTPDLHRSPSYIRYQQARLSLVAETSSAVQANDALRRQRLTETEAILTRKASIHSQNSNASNRYSVRSGTSPSLSARMNSTEQVHLQPENYTSHSARRRSHLTPGVATRMGETSKAQRSSRLQKQNPKARRQSAAEPQPSQTFSHYPERSKTLPSEEEINSYYNDQSMPSESPVEDLEMLAPLQKPRFREDLTNTQRMSTPTDLRHIGSFELGSLRIMNGAAPSAANTPKARRKLRTDSEEDNASPRTTVASVASLARRHPMEQGNTHEVKQPRQPEVIFNPGELTIDPPSRSPSTETKQSVYSDIRDISRASSQRLETAPQRPGGASELAEFYRLDIDFLPSLFAADLSMPSTPKLETTSKPTSEEDELFEDAKSDFAVFEDARSELGVPDRRSPLSERRSHRSEAPRRQDDELYLPAVETMSQRRREQIPSTSVHARLETVAVTDSGYSSYTSLGSVQSSGSRSKLRDTSESPTELDRQLVAQPAEYEVSSRPRVPKADFWRTQHAPSDMAREYRAEPAPPSPVREAPASASKSQMPKPPIPTTAAHMDDSLESQSEAERTKSTSNSAPTSPKRPSLLQHRTAGNVLQKSSRPRPNSLAAQGRANSDDTITPVKKKWHRHSSQLSSEAPITVQKHEEPEKANVQPVPPRVSLTFKQRARRFSGLKNRTSASDNVEPVEREEKPTPPPSKEQVQRSIRRQSSPANIRGIRLVPSEASSVEPTTTTTPTFTSTSTPTLIATPISTPTFTSTSTPTLLSTPSSKTPKPRSPPKDTIKVSHSPVDFERHITTPSTTTTSLGASHYDAGATAIAPSPTPGANPPTNPPRRDRTGRIIGMDEESASNFARARSKARVKEKERREVKVTRIAQSISEGNDGVSPTAAAATEKAAPNNSSSANKLAIPSQRALVPSAAATLNVPSVPALNVPVPEARQSPLMKGKREKIGPPPTLMNGRNRKHGILGFWSASSSSSSGKDSPIDVPKHPMPMGPVGSAGEIPAIVSAKSAGFTTPGNRNLPSMAPQWKGPSPAELAEMALQARKEGKTSMDAKRRSMSANGTYDRRGSVVVESRPGSVMSETQAVKGRRRGWSFRSRKEGEV